MKVWRCGFMRWRTREEPWGSHHVEARALKCDISEALTEGELSWVRCVEPELVLDVVELWYLLAMDTVANDFGLRLCRSWRALAAAQRGINDFIVTVFRQRAVVKGCHDAARLPSMSACARARRSGVRRMAGQ